MKLKNVKIGQLGNLIVFKFNKLVIIMIADQKYEKIVNNARQNIKNWPYFSL